MYLQETRGGDAGRHHPDLDDGILPFDLPGFLRSNGRRLPGKMYLQCTYASMRDHSNFLTTMKNSCLFLLVECLNELPADVRIAESLTSFRKRLETHLFRVHLDSA
ncbi:unnamed protein product [Boreogadus saida]